MPVGKSADESGLGQRQRDVLRARKRDRPERRRGVERGGDIDRDRFRRRIQVDTAIGRAAVVLHLEHEQRVGAPEPFGGRGELEFAVREVGERDHLTRGDRDIVVFQTAGQRQRRDLHREQTVRRTIVWIGEAEIRRRKNVVRVRGHRDRLGRAGGRVIHRCHVDRHRRRRPAAAAGVDHEIKPAARRAVGVGRRRVGQRGKFVRLDRHAIRHIDRSKYLIHGESITDRPGKITDSDRGQRPIRIREIEVSRREGPRRVLEGRHTASLRHGSIVDGQSVRVIAAARVNSRAAIGG